MNARMHLAAAILVAIALLAAGCLQSQGDGRTAPQKEVVIGAMPFNE